MCTIAVSLARKDGVANDSACSLSLSRQSAVSSEAVEAAAASAATPTAKQANVRGTHTHTRRDTGRRCACLWVKRVRWRWLRSWRRQRVDSAVDVTLLLACSARFGFSSFSYVVHAERKSGQSAPTHTTTRTYAHTHTATHTHICRHTGVGRETNQYREAKTERRQVNQRCC